MAIQHLYKKAKAEDKKKMYVEDKKDGKRRMQRGMREGRKKTLGYSKTNEREEAKNGKTQKEKRVETGKESEGKQWRQCVVNRGLSRHLRGIKTEITIKVRRRYLPSSSSHKQSLRHWTAHAHTNTHTRTTAFTVLCFLSLSLAKWFENKLHLTFTLLPRAHHHTQTNLDTHWGKEPNTLKDADTNGCCCKIRKEKLHCSLGD